MPTEQEWAYLAGLFDGEGTTILYTKKRQYALSISNTYLPLLEWCKQVSGVGTIYKVGYKLTPHWKQAYCWKVQKLSDILFVTNGILPFLKLKAAEIQVLRDFSEKKVEARIQESNHMRRPIDNVDLNFENLMRSVKIPRGRKEDNAYSIN